MNPGAAPAVPGPVLLRQPRPRHPGRPTSRRVPQQPRPSQLAAARATIRDEVSARIPATLPEWAQNPPAPLTLARRGLATIKASEEGAGRNAAIAVGAYAAWWVATTPYTAALLVLTAVGYGLVLCRRRVAAGVGAGGLVLLVTGRPFLASVLAVAAAQLVARQPDREPKATGRWSHDRLARALLAAKVLTKPADAELPTLRYLGKPGHKDELGNEWGTILLPAGATYEHARKRHHELASALGLAADDLHLEHDRGQPSAAVTIAMLAPRSLLPAVAAVPDRTDWTQPVRLGVDRRGRAVDLRTTNVQTAFVGQTGSGKTRLARLLVLHAVLDPRVPLAVLSFKDDEEDWRPMRPLCEGRYVGGTTRASLEQAVELLELVERISEHRGRLRRADRQPMVVVVDEWARAVKAAHRYDPALAARLGSLFAELAATTRSREVHLVTTWQRGTVTYIDGDLRANLTQKAVGMTTKESETRYVLDCVPQALPTEPGEFLVSMDDGDPTLVRVPNLDDDAFQAACQRAAVLRAAEPHPPVLPAHRPTDPTVTVPTQADPFAGAVLQALEAGPMTPTALRQSVAPDLTPHAFAARLKTVGGIEKGSGGTGGKLRVYRRTDRRDDALRAPGAVAHAQTGTLPVELSEVTVLP